MTTRTAVVAVAVVEDGLVVARVARGAQAARRRMAVVRMEPQASTRVDKWLWCVRLCKTRTLATETCAAGHVQVNGQPAKPSRSVRPGDAIILTTDIIRTVRVLALLKVRIGAKLVPNYVEDLTPPAEYEKLREKTFAPTGHRPKGAGRPTKRDRRILSSFFGAEE